MSECGIGILHSLLFVSTKRNSLLYFLNIKVLIQVGNSLDIVLTLSYLIMGIIIARELLFLQPEYKRAMYQDLSPMNLHFILSCPISF